jgi:hypothetical protein
MTAPVAAAALALLLAASPAAPDPEDTMTDAEALSAAAGGILGAASVCRSITDERLNAATTQVARLVTAVMTDPDELTSAHALFVENASAGKLAVASGATDCGTVERSLTTLERLGDKGAPEAEPGILDQDN